MFWNYITDIQYNSLNETSRIIVLIQTLQITAEEVKLMKGAEPYGVIYRETRCDNASQSKKKMTTHKLKQWNSFALKCNDEDKQTNVGGIK